MMGLIPSRAAIMATLGALIAACIAWARRDARQDTLTTLTEEDHQNADDITDRVSNDRADPKRLQPHTDAGFRD